MLIPVILVWVISALAGISFLSSAMKEQSKPARKGLKKFWAELRFRLTFAVGVAMILWVISSVFWLLLNWRTAI